MLKMNDVGAKKVIIALNDVKIVFLLLCILIIVVA